MSEYNLQPSYTDVSSLTTRDRAISIMYGRVPITGQIVPLLVDGSGALAVSGGGGGSGPTISVPVSALTTISVAHGLGYYPLVQVLDASGFMVLPNTLQHTDTSNFTVTFSVPFTGHIIYR